jgi:alkylated DNA nucleotide flippase Atl1
MAKSWQEKMADKKDTPKLLKLEKRFPCYNAVHKMGAEEGDDIVLVNPREVEALMKLVPKGKLTTLIDVCLELAAQYKVKGCCTLTAGIFTMTAANAAEEMKAEGKTNDLPYWRTLKSNGELNPKYPGGIEGHQVLLEREGYTVIRKGKRAFVKDFESYLYEF